MWVGFTARGELKARTGSVTDPGSWPLSSTAVGKRPDEEFRQGFLVTHATAAGSENRTQFPLLAPWQGVEPVP